MIQLIEVCELSTASKNSQQRFTLREVYVNPKHVISLREDARFKQKLNEGVLPPDLDERQKFTRVTIDKGNAGQEIVVFIRDDHTDFINGTNLVLYRANDFNFSETDDILKFVCLDGTKWFMSGNMNNT